MLSAQGALWLDEAASAIYAHEAGTPIGVFLNINHDNNHHLNSIWMQMVGFDASPMLQRALSIVTGTLAIVLAGLIGARRAPGVGLIAAALFALSPMLVTLGSEARGYAPMTAAFLTAMLLTDRWLAGELKERPTIPLALCFLIGATSHLAIIFAFCALAGWAFIALWQRTGFADAVRQSLRLYLPSALAMAAVVAIIWRAAAVSPKGYVFGGWTPFSWTTYVDGLSVMLNYTLGAPFLHQAWLVLLPVIVLIAFVMRVSRMPFHALAIVAFPLAIAVLQPGNVGLGRYYLPVTLALLFLLAEMAWLAFADGGWRRWSAVAVLGAIGVGSLTCDIMLIRNQRGDVGAAIRALQARAPGGTQVIIERESGLPQVITAAASAHYPLRAIEQPGECPAPRFLFVDRFGFEQFPVDLRRCGRSYAPIAGAHTTGMSGSHWKLYEIAR